MVKEIKSSEIKKFLESNPKTVLLDVRTEDEWNTVGKPDTKDLGIKSYFITISQDPIFVDSVKQNIDIKEKILVMCAAGGRSIIAANLLEKEGYDTLNVSDGFSGNGQEPGWKNLGLPSVIDN
jgi:rhodanese-related sulfurtransferase